ncbi:Crp/Fnr family transcriptional regulator [Gillisia sp. M10.2A]|uniref:Crp/Fnr family transcriptional regulator n=1 Tax=Gillisia lutea TaxID=2909668 RepID=A0ABS9EF87_9FLAO|nr:Crp/Fnr family transcriptional regulator [Gillisia lutea]MCF4101547.1 Crp/Fnr family transcriptional regulator [Gillisia lutea]
MKQQILDHILKFVDLSLKEQDEFLSILTEKHLRKKQFLISPGELVSSEFYVVKGCLQAYCIDEKGEKHIIQFAVDDWWISDFEAFFNQQPAKLYIEALEDSYLLEINKEALETLYKRIPIFERFFRIKTTNAFVSLRGRILSILQKSGKERYLEFCAIYPNIEKRVANYHIANYLGIKPESLSRIRKEML